MCMEVSPSKKIGEGLIKFGVDGVSTSQGEKLGVIVHVIKKMVIVPCIAYRTDLVVLTLVQFKVVRHVKDLLATSCSYFNSFLQMCP